MCNRPFPYNPMPLQGGESPSHAREIPTPPWTAKDLSRRRVHHQWSSPSVPVRSLQKSHSVLAPGEHERRQLAELLGQEHCLREDVRAHVVGVSLLRYSVRSSAHCCSIARRAALKRCLRVTRSMTALSNTADASSSNAVGLSLPPKISRCSIRNAMIAFPAHDAMMSSLPAELSASLRGEKHSATTTPESWKNNEYPPMLAAATPLGKSAVPLGTPPRRWTRN